MKFTSSLKLKLIYVFRINDAAHKGCLKVGEATCDNDNVFGLAPNSKALNESAKKRINQYTQTAGIAYDLLYTELTIYNSKYGLCSFNDKEVHSVLERSGIKKKIFDTENKANEWFITDLETVKRAIIAVKEGRESLSSAEVSHDKSPIVFRPEQREAIEKTKKQFKKGNQMLWNAKMRFGKTLSALQEVKDMDFSRTLILTHRPVVDSGWFEDFGKIFYDRRDFAYGSKNNGDSHTSLETRAKQGQCKYVYFASMQDLRGSELVGGNFDKNNEVFATAWDCIIVDEAHEGTQTDLGKAVMQELTKDKTKILRLSGTPFNLLDDFKEDEIYTWDYVMEQRAKASWDELHFGDPNPYASLPTMNIYTYDLGRLLNEFVDEDVAFNFREFFRVNDNGTFVHDKDVSAFLNLITKEDRESCYPFANEEYRNIFRHTLWMLPGVKEARAMSAMLQTHSVFQHFKVVNVAGNGDEDEESKGFFKKKKDKKDQKDILIEELNDKYRRTMAEFDNFRKRTEKEKSTMFDMGAKSVVEKLLPIIDNFERGFAGLSEEQMSDPFVSGMDMVYKQLVKALADMGVEPIEAVGKPFDPNLHNAVMHVEDENLGENTVAQEFQKGYLYHGSVVRHSMVQVAN